MIFILFISDRTGCWAGELLNILTGDLSGCGSGDEGGQLLTHSLKEVLPARKLLVTSSSHVFLDTVISYQVLNILAHVVLP